MILHISRFFNRITSILYEIKYGFQRMFRHYDDRDSWDVGYSVLKLMEYNIPKMRKSRNFGRPSCFETIEDWEEILDTIYLGVQSAIKVYDNNFNIAKLLLQNNADLTIKNDNGDDVFSYISSDEMKNLLLSYK